MHWESGAFPGKWHEVNNDNEVSASTEILISRILAAMGVLSSCKGHISSLRSAFAENNQFKVKEICGAFLDRLTWSAVRLYKLNYCSDLIHVTIFFYNFNNKN